MGVAERRAREREERRDGIVDAAERVFLEKGLDAATMDEIADAAELSKGALYLHFTGKDELYIAVVSRFMCGLRDGLVEATAGAESGIDELRCILTTQVRFASDRPDLFRLGMSWLLTKVPIDYSTETFAQHLARVRANIGRTVAAIERGQRDGTVRADLPPLLTARQLWSSMVGVLLLDVNANGMHMRMPEMAAIGPAAPAFVELLLHSLRPETTPGESL